jgi:hypothetical protein
VPLLHRRFARLFLLSQKPSRSHVWCLSTSRLLSSRGSRSAGSVIHLPRSRSLLQFRLLQVLFFSASVLIYSEPPTHNVDVRILLRALERSFPAYCHRETRLIHH